MTCIGVVLPCSCVYQKGRPARNHPTPPMIMFMRPAGCSAPSHCIFRFLKLGVSLGLFSCLASTTQGVVDATLTPSTTSSTSTTPVVLHVTGLSNGDSVTVERYVDADESGTVDAGEFLAEMFTVTDGQVTSIGGVRNTNIPGDEDLAADGQISINLIPALGSELGRLAGEQIIRISSPAETPTFTTFTKY